MSAKSSYCVQIEDYNANIRRCVILIAENAQAAKAIGDTLCQSHRETVIGVQFIEKLPSVTLDGRF